MPHKPLVILGLLWASAAWAGSEVDVLAPKPIAVPRGGCQTTVQFEIARGLHIQANPAAKPNLIPAEIKVTEPNAPAWSIAPKYPKPMLYQMRDGSTLKVYGGELAIPVMVRPPRDAAPHAHRLAMTLRYQACTDSVCLRPSETHFVMDLRLDPSLPASKMCRSGG